MNKETLRKYFSENLARKLAALVLLVSFSANIFAEAVPDPVSIGNARATRTASGIEQLDIATPNAKGLSYNPKQQPPRCCGHADSGACGKEQEP